MNYKRQGLRAFGLSILAALGLMAFMAPGAQAGAGEWLILPAAGGVKTLKELTPQLETITGRQLGTENLLQVLVLNIRLYCENVAVESAHIVPLGHAKATLKFSTCKLTDAAGNKNNTCIVDPITANVLGLLVNHSTPSATQRWILFSPLTGLTFVTPTFLDAPGEECSVTPAEIKGHVVAAIASGSGVHAVKQLISTVGTLSLFSDKLFFGANESHLKAHAEVELSGANHGGRPWGYHVL